jgi:hypothetical protein
MDKHTKQFALIIFIISLTFCFIVMVMNSDFHAKVSREKKEIIELTK